MVRFFAFNTRTNLTSNQYKNNERKKVVKKLKVMIKNSSRILASTEVGMLMPSFLLIGQIKHAQFNDNIYRMDQT